MTRNIERRILPWRPRRIGRGATDTPTPSKSTLEGSGGPKTPEVTSDTSTAVSGLSEAYPWRPVATEEGYGLTVGTIVAVDGQQYRLHDVRGRYATGRTPPYFALVVAAGDPAPSCPLGAEEHDGQVVVWVSHLRATISRAPYQPKVPQRRSIWSTGHRG